MKHTERLGIKCGEEVTERSHGERERRASNRREKWRESFEGLGVCAVSDEL